MVSDIVEIAPKINVDDAGEPLHQPVHNTIQRLVRCALGPVSKRTVVKVSFKDRSQDKLHSSLNDSILNGGNSKLAALAVPFRDLYPSVLGRFVNPCEKLLLN